MTNARELFNGFVESNLHRAYFQLFGISADKCGTTLGIWRELQRCAHEAHTNTPIGVVIKVTFKTNTYIQKMIILSPCYRQLTSTEENVFIRKYSGNEVPGIGIIYDTNKR
jgi:hypothetical protein